MVKSNGIHGSKLCKENAEPSIPANQAISTLATKLQYFFGELFMCNFLVHKLICICLHTVQ